LFFYGNSDHSTSLNSNNISYTINDEAAGGNSSANFYQNGSSLIIKKNIDSVCTKASNSLHIIATVAANSVEDTQTKVKNEQAVVADIDFSLISSG